MITLQLQTRSILWVQPSVDVSLLVVVCSQSSFTCIDGQQAKAAAARSNHAKSQHPPKPLIKPRVVAFEVNGPPAAAVHSAGNAAKHAPLRSRRPRGCIVLLRE